MTPQGPTPPPHAALTSQGAPQSPSGYLTLGLCAMLLGLHQVGLLEHPAWVAAGFLYGGSCQVLVGLNEWRRGNAFGAVTFTACGLLWLSLLPMLVLPAAGIGQVPQAAASAPYLVMWGLFCAILGHGCGQGQRLAGYVFGSLMLLLLVTAAALAWESANLHRLVCLAGALCGFLATLQGFSLFSSRLKSRQPLAPGAFGKLP